MAQKNRNYIDFNKNGKLDIYENSKESIARRVEDLLSQMTIDEKIGQLVTLYGFGKVLNERLPKESWKDSIWRFGVANIDEHLTGFRVDSVYAFPFQRHVQALNTVQEWFVKNTRLGIPVDFSVEGTSGLNHMYTTFFPCQLAQACSFDTALVYQINKVIGKEAHALGYTNVYAPVLDVASDPRWGRIVDTYGSDPFLIGQLGRAAASGIQSNGIASTLKHFAAYSVPIGGRDGKVRTDPQITLTELINIYLEPFRYIIKKVHPLGIMASYNDYDGIPIMANSYFLNTILRNKFNFKGSVIGDSNGLDFLFNKHWVAQDSAHAAAMALNAGLNVNSAFKNPEKYLAALKRAIKEKLVSNNILNTRVKEVLEVKFQLGLFDNPIQDTSLTNDIHNSEHKSLSLKAAEESIVLLKNNKILPLDLKKIKSIALIGPNADETASFYSRYGSVRTPTQSIYGSFIERTPPNVQIKYVKGIDHIDPNFPTSDIESFPLDNHEQQQIREAVEVAKSVDVCLLILGDNEKTVGESKSRLSLKLPGHQAALAEAIIATGKPCVFIHIGARPVSQLRLYNDVSAAIEAFYLGEFTGDALYNIIAGSANPSGHLCMPILKDVGQLPLSFPHKIADDAGGNASVSGFLFPFGHGLTYSSFTYSDLKILRPHNTDFIDVVFNITNTSNKNATVVPQVYVRDSMSGVVPYDKLLKGFDRYSLMPGETLRAVIKIPLESIYLFDKDYQKNKLSKYFMFMVGESSEDIRLRTSIRISN